MTMLTPAVEVFCSTVFNPISSATRVVTISACLQSLCLFLQRSFGGCDLCK